MEKSQILNSILIDQTIWLPSIISMTSGLIGAAVGGCVAWIINKQNHEEERRKIEEKEKRDEKKTIQNIYGKMYSLNIKIIHYLQLENCHSINQQLFLHLYNIENKNSNEKEKNYKIHTDEYEKQIKMATKVREATGEYAEYIGQYKYLNPESKIMDRYYDFFEKCKQIQTELEFRQTDTAKELQNRRDAMYIEVCKILETEIKTSLNNILEKISENK